MHKGVILKDEAAEARSVATPTPRDWLQVPPRIHTLSCLPTITGKKPPLHPCSEWHANLPWALTHPQWEHARVLLSSWAPRLRALGPCAVSTYQKEPAPIPGQVPVLADSAGWRHMAQHPAQASGPTCKCCQRDLGATLPQAPRPQ